MKKLPIVALIGQTNAGKSSILNRMAHKNIAIVAREEGTTRDNVVAMIDDEATVKRFYKENIMTSDAEKAFHDLRLNTSEEIYFQLNFPSIPPDPLYLAVLEENPYVPELFIPEKDRIAAQQLLENSVLAFQEQLLLKQIDEALDAGDKERFFELSNLLQALKHTK